LTNSVISDIMIMYVIAVFSIWLVASATNIKFSSVHSMDFISLKICFIQSNVMDLKNSKF